MCVMRMCICVCFCELLLFLYRCQVVVGGRKGFVQLLMLFFLVLLFQLFCVFSNFQCSSRTGLHVGDEDCNGEMADSKGIYTTHRPRESRIWKSTHTSVAQSIIRVRLKLTYALGLAAAAVA